MAELKQRYVRGELADDEMERKVETLIAAEEPTDREREPERR